MSKECDHWYLTSFGDVEYVTTHCVGCKQKNPNLRNHGYGKNIFDNDPRILGYAPVYSGDQSKRVAYCCGDDERCNQDGCACHALRCELAAQSRELASLRAKVRMLEKDAERYVLLREKVGIAGGLFHILNLSPTYVAPNAAIELDAVIDAAIERSKG